MRKFQPVLLNEEDIREFEEVFEIEEGIVKSHAELNESLEEYDDVYSLDINYERAVENGPVTGKIEYKIDIPGTQNSLKGDARRGTEQYNWLDRNMASNSLNEVLGQ